MLILDGSSDKITLVTSSSADTDVQVSFTDFPVGASTMGRKNTAIISATTTDISGSPAVSTQRNIKHISVRNKHASTSQTVTFQHVGPSTVEIFSCILAAGQQMSYDGQEGFRVYNSAGAQRFSFPAASTLAITDDTTTNAVMYPVWVNASTGTPAPKVSSTKMSFNPLAGVLSLVGLNTTGVVGIGTPAPTYLLSFGTLLYTSGSKLALYENAGTDVYGFGVTSGSVNFFAGGSQTAAFRNSGQASMAFGLTIGASVFSTASPSNGLLCQGGVMLGSSGDPGTGNIGLVAIPSTALVSTFSGLLIGGSSFTADNTIAATKALEIAQNLIQSSAGTYKYISTDVAMLYRQLSVGGVGTHYFYTAVSGTAGNTATLVEVAKFTPAIASVLTDFTLLTSTSIMRIGGQQVLSALDGGTQTAGATTGAMTVVPVAHVITITPTGACTFNTTTTARTGQWITFKVTTSGTTSYVLTWGTNFKTVGTLATGTTSGKVFMIRFMYDGATWIEGGRTTAM